MDNAIKYAVSIISKNQVKYFKNTDFGVITIVWGNSIFKKNNQQRLVAQLLSKDNKKLVNKKSSLIDKIKSIFKRN